MTFLTYPNAPKGDYEHTHEQPLIVVIPYVILSLLAIFFGYVAKDLFVGPGSDFLSSALFIHPTHITLIEAEFSLPLFYKLLPAIGSMIGALSALLIYNGSTYPGIAVSLTLPQFGTTANLGHKIGYTMYKFFNGKYFFDVIYNHYIINSALGLGLLTSKVLDRGLVEKVGPFGLTDSFSSTSRQLATLDSGVVTSYALYIILGFISLTLLLFVPVLFPADNLTGTTADNMGDLRLVLLFVSALALVMSSSSSRKPVTD